MKGTLGKKKPKLIKRNSNEKVMIDTSTIKDEYTENEQLRQYFNENPNSDYTKQTIQKSLIAHPLQANVDTLFNKTLGKRKQPT
jgi:hypothetical protein